MVPNLPSHNRRQTMNATYPSHAAGTIERVLRQHLSQPGSAAQEAATWDGPSVSRFLSGQQGVPIGKIDALLWQVRTSKRWLY